MDTQNISTIILRYKDSSVPPRFHRSYTITVNRKQSHVIIDSYGKTTAEKTVDLEGGAFEILVEEAGKLQNAQTFKYDKSATGMNFHTLSLKNENGTAYQLKWDSLSKENIEEHTFEFKQKILATIPDFSNLKK